MQIEKTLTSKKEILLVVRWPVGGIRTFIRYVYRNFAPERWRLTILAPDLPEMRVLIEDLAGFDVRYIPVEEEPRPAQFFLKVALELLTGSYHLVHSHGFTSGMSAALPAFVRRTPHLMTSHETLNSRQFSGIKGRGMRLGMAVLFSLIGVVHSVSYDAQENLLEFFPSLVRKVQKCVVIPSGIEIERFEEARPRDLRGELNLCADTFLIGFLGRFMSEKGFHYLIDAVDLLRAKDGLAKHPLVVTFGEGAFIREEKQAIEERGLTEYFCFMPFTPNVAGIIKGLDIVVMPSLWEACGLLAMEALVCGTPLIGSDCIGLREVLRGTPAKIVAMADASGLADALEQEMEVSSRELFLSYREIASKKFNVTATSLLIMKLYERVTGSEL